MLDIIKTIIDLQAEWSSDNTPAMQERGGLVRNSLPIALRRFTPQFSTILDISEADIGIVGRDGSGRKTAIPWVRIFSQERSPNPQTGWYIVLLFHSEGEKLYLCISHGSTDWIDGEFKPKPASEIAPLMHWASTLLEPFFKSYPDLKSKISLGGVDKVAHPQAD
ncbi:DUF3578 domain-containing protein [Phyllobacterium sp. 628]|uniref:MrcB family domain-containing protein n=1 Tax=Phyllobacterium sp. 628 TaxID=2718938 RepID=UPI0016621D0D|nr:DUF3578 domain-containing protein [Phyllobacterium sp. 628]QND51829.1 DUF3578 domain-containing protein [Phyllobacterium sp. 628]